MIARAGRSRPSAPSGIRISGATACAPSSRNPCSSKIRGYALEQVIVAAAEYAKIRGSIRSVLKSVRICRMAGRTIEPMKTTSRQPSRRASRPKRANWPTEAQ